MIGKHFGRVVHVAGTLAANIGVVISMPVDARLSQVSAVASNASNATITVGVGTDADNILTAQDVGDSGTPAVFDVGDWASTNRNGVIKKGELLTVTVDYDGATGTAAQDLTVDLDFIEG